MDDSRLHLVATAPSPRSENETADAAEITASRNGGRFGEFEDVISVGALMRPTLAKAMATLSPEERRDLKVVLLEVEKHLSKASLPYLERFSLVRESFTRTYRYGPIWRFIAGRIEESWTSTIAPSVREFSMVSLLVGMILEEVHRADAGDAGSSKKSRIS